MMVGRLIGWVLILGGIAMLVRDVMGWLATSVWAPLALGELWIDLNSSSFNLVQDLVQHDLDPFLWDPIITSVLVCWAFVVFIVLGLLVHHLFRGRPSKNF